MISQPLDPIGFRPIPPIFHSFLGEGPFENCLVCDRFLLEDGVGYLIERAFQKAEPIWEYALCFECQECGAEGLSAASLQRLEAHFGERVDLEERRRRLIESHGFDVDAWIDRCVLTGRKRSHSRVYALYAMCDGPDLLFSGMPYMISDEGFQQIQRLLSKRTRDCLDDFVGKYLGFSPELADPPVTFF